MKKSTKILFPVFLSLALLAGIAIGVFFNFPARGIVMSESSIKEQKLRQIINYIDYEYVDQVNTDSLLDLTISELLAKLDPHSSYIPGDRVAASEESMRGSFDGIGIEFKIYRDTLTVVRVLEGGPSEKAGLREGDRILTAGEKVLYGAGVAADKVVSTLKGEAGTPVGLNVYRPSEKSNEYISVQRGEVPLKSVQSAFVLEDGIGYLKLTRFSETSGEEVEDEIRRLQRKGAHKLVLDLRDNPGGLLSAARDVADAFLGKGELIVFTKDRRGNKSSIYASSKGRFEKGDLVVLINEGSASASEIVAGALQDNDRGWIIGKRSFGKGLVQEEMTLGDGSKVRLTTRRYYTPSGRSIQKDFGNYDHSFMEQSGYEEQSGDGAQTASIDTGRVYHTEAGRTVYGGGGIMPDIEVHADTGRSRALMYHLSLVSDFDEKAFSYVDKHRQQLKEWSEGEFVDAFEVDEAIMKHFFGERASTKIEKQPEKSRELVKTRIKALIGYNLFGNSVFQQSFARHDPAIAAALQTLKEQRPLVQ